MKLKKRDGSLVEFDKRKIEVAVEKANATMAPADKLTDEQIAQVATDVATQCLKEGGIPTVEGVQDMVVLAIHELGAHRLGVAYTNYRRDHEALRRENTTDAKILALLERNNDEAKQENANKNPVINSTQRDYMAGEVSRDLAERILLPKEVVEAHRAGIIHFHE